MPKWSGQDCFACLHKSRLGWPSNGWNNGKGIALTYIARIRLQRSTCYSGVPFRGYASVKNATEPSSTCKHDVTIDSDVGTVCARFRFDHRLLKKRKNYVITCDWLVERNEKKLNECLWKDWKNFQDLIDANVTFKWPLTSIKFIIFFFRSLIMDGQFFFLF